ncbi:MAG: hypothetical protein N0E55_07135 [Candidatus Thiodiazotropha taylori]|nr:hypothetical protein [Candidatus Thiodiazotropha taylori]MCG8108589.1 hypothetical protein [Candidatus Thiodiazotropha taylori]MCG8112417.1 hypothetical protein [Candidatus Thiodiazotropha taylori]MCG8123725.1 hypothetical protein [Candidatus Thiodiazotropha taylori]MCW4252467.1 hypothetical protein [Candidatus Thiodiazotropha taylori]
MRFTNSHYFYSNSQRSINAVLILLFLLAQSATLLHAEVHEFHDHDHEEYCDTFKSLEKHHYYIGVSAIQISHVPQDRAETTFHLAKTSLHSSQFYEARASPALISTFS